MAINWIPQKAADQHKSAWLRMTSNSIGARFIVGLKKYRVSSHEITCMWIQQEHFGLGILLTFIHLQYDDTSCSK